MKIEIKAVLAGILGALLLLVLFFTILTLINSFDHATTSFAERWYLIILLAFGFGVQVALYYYARTLCRIQNNQTSASVAASGGISTTSMVACCAHHVADAPALIGFGGAALFFAEYQNFFIMIGIVSNALGSAHMLRVMQEHRIFEEKSFLGSFFARYDMKRAFKLLLGLGIAVLLVTALAITKSRTTAAPENTTAVTIPPETPSAAKGLELAPKSDDRNRITVKVSPLPLKYGEEVNFAIVLDTHSVDLTYDLVALSLLEDSRGNEYKAIRWDGPKPGGHHTSGTLVFPPINQKTNMIKLTIKNINNADRVFEWEVN